MVYTTRTNSLLTRCKQRAVRYSPRCTNRDPHFRLYLRESQRPPLHGRTPIAPWANAHRPMGVRPPPRGRSPTAPWALAFCFTGTQKKAKRFFPLLLVRRFWVLFNENAPSYKQGVVLSRFPILCSMNCPQNCPKSPHFRQFHQAGIYPMFVQM